MSDWLSHNWETSDDAFDALWELEFHDFRAVIDAHARNHVRGVHRDALLFPDMRQSVRSDLLSILESLKLQKESFNLELEAGERPDPKKQVGRNRFEQGVVERIAELDYLDGAPT